MFLISDRIHCRSIWYYASSYADLPRERGLFDAINTVVMNVTERARKPSQKNANNKKDVKSDEIVLPISTAVAGKEIIIPSPEEIPMGSVLPRKKPKKTAPREPARTEEKLEESIALSDNSTHLEEDESSNLVVRNAKKGDEPKTRPGKSLENEDETIDKNELKREIDLSTEGDAIDGEKKKIDPIGITEAHDTSADTDKVDFNSKHGVNDKPKRSRQRDSEGIGENRSGISFDRNITEDGDGISPDETLTKNRDEMSADTSKDFIIVEEGFEVLPQPQAYGDFQLRFCNNPIHGILGVFTTLIIGFSIILFRLFINKETRKIKGIHMLIQIIAIIILSVAIWISKDSGYSTPRSFLDLHVYGGWITFILLLLQVFAGLIIYTFFFKNGNMRQFMAPFHDIVGIFIFICLVGSCISGKRGLRNDYTHLNMIVYYLLTYLAFVIILYILLSPYYEWALVGPM
uniref:Cytochrome b561 domain-containing protein n=1 Tax=Glossina pallidipes TaxID=7398 RepID=A0A1B0AI72_GLOPL